MKKEVLKLLTNTNAYKIVLGDRLNGTLTHAYMLECSDALMLREYLKTLAKLILCENGIPCDDCRLCRLIDKEIHSDIFIYPQAGEKLKVVHADEIVENCVVRPLESDKKIFIICGFDTLEKNQNKLLKTLEEPPENIILLIGTSNPTGILPTVKSRVKRIEIPAFSDKMLLSSLSDCYPDREKFMKSVELSNGHIGNLEANYERGDYEQMQNIVLDALMNLDSSRDILRISKNLALAEIKQLLSVIKHILGELLKYKCTAMSRLSAEILKKLNDKYKMGAIIEIIGKINEIERAVHFNANRTMVIDKMLFSILEAKYKWQKL